MSSLFRITLVQALLWLTTTGSTLDEIPIIDLTTNDVAPSVAKACREIGFFVVKGHGVNPLVLDRAWEATRKFFDAPDSYKQSFATTNETEYPYGYEQSEVLTRGKQLDGDNNNKDDSTTTSSSSSSPPGADLKETFALGPSNPASGMPPRRFPEGSVEFQSALADYYAEIERLAEKLLQIFALALDLPLDWFGDKMDHHMSALRLLNYFSIPAGSHPQGRAPIVRAGAHSDYGVLTILKTGGPGLQVQDIDHKDRWIDVPYVEDGFVLNLGDLMQRWTNDKWVSTLHRVVAVPDGKTGSVPRRQAMAFFVNLNGDATVTPLSSPAKYPPILARDHLMAKHLASMGHEVKDEL